MNIRLLYLYLFSFIGLLIAVIGTVQIVDLALKLTVFRGADVYEYYPAPLETQAGTNPEEQAEYEAQIKIINEREQVRQRQRQFSTAISMIVVGVPLYLYHWQIITRESKTPRRKK